MQEIYQKTLAEKVSFEGVGLHSGKTSKITILPSKGNEGIIFKRIDLGNNNVIKANYKNVSSAKLCTTLENSNGVKVSTVEHLLAAFYLSGIDNALVEINSEEIPIMDGSAKNFLDVLKKSQIKILPEKRKFLKALDKVELIDGTRNISIEPSNQSLEVQFQLNYDNEIIGKQKNTINFDKDKTEDISTSRTFCLYQDIEKIKKAGLAKGGSLNNAIVVDNDKILNEGGLRNEKEFVNHKILDLIGDFMLSGYRIIGKVKCYQGGHELTNMFLRKLLGTKSFDINSELNTIKISQKITNKFQEKLAASA